MVRRQAHQPRLGFRAARWIRHAFRQGRQARGMHFDPTQNPPLARDYALTVPIRQDMLKRAGRTCYASVCKGRSESQYG